jgi:hypothetical protein
MPAAQTLARRRHATEQRRRQVSAQRLAGIADQGRIARQLGVSQATISRDFDWLDAQYRREASADIQAHKGRDLQRIEAAITAIWSDVTQGRAWAGNLLVKYLERKARLLGLDAPASFDLQVRAEYTRVAGALDLDAGQLIRWAEEIVDERQQAY